MFLMILTLSIVAAHAEKNLKFRIKNEALKIEGNFLIAQVDFETGSKLQVSWCRTTRLDPTNCIPVEGDSGYKVDNKQSLFYFIYMGSTVLRKMAKGDVGAFHVTFHMNKDHYRYTHVINVPEGIESTSSRRNIAQQEVLTVPTSQSLPRGQPIIFQCVVQSLERLQITWYRLSSNGHGSEILYSENTIGAPDPHIIVDAKVVMKGEQMAHESALEISHMTDQDDGIYVCRFTSDKTGDFTELRAVANAV